MASSKNRYVALVVAGLVSFACGGEAAWAKDKPRQLHGKRVRDNSGAPAGVGKPVVSPQPPTTATQDQVTLRYDTGSYHTLPTMPASNSSYYGPRFAFGNRFVLADATMETASYDVTFLSFWMARVDYDDTGSGNAYVSLYQAPSGARAERLGYLSVDVEAGAFNQINITGAEGLSGPSFLAVVRNSEYASSDEAPCDGDCVGMDTGVVGDLGFHACRIAIPSYGTDGDSYDDIAGQNAMIRVGVAGTLPVELLSFTVE